jgi:hypothetical protein
MACLIVTLTALTAVAGAIASGCSSDNTTPGSGDSGMDVTTTDTGAADRAADGPVDAAKEAAPCVDAAVNVATFNSGSPLWACFQSACVAELATCSADCTCNTAIFGALLCAADGGNQMACFVTGFGLVGTAGAALQTCLLNNLTTCSGGGGDAAPDGAREGGAEGGRDGGTEGGADAGTDSGAADGGTDDGSDGGATDAPASG